MWARCMPVELTLDSVLFNVENGKDILNWPLCLWKSLHLKDVAIELSFLAGVCVGKLVLCDRPENSESWKYDFLWLWEENSQYSKTFFLRVKGSQDIHSPYQDLVCSGTPTPQGPLLCQVVNFGSWTGNQAWAFSSWHRNTACSGRKAAEISSLSEAIETLKEHKPYKVANRMFFNP